MVTGDKSNFNNYPGYPGGGPGSDHLFNNHPSPGGSISSGPGSPYHPLIGGAGGAGGGGRGAPNMRHPSPPTGSPGGGLKGPGSNSWGGGGYPYPANNGGSYNGFNGVRPGSTSPHTNALYGSTMTSARSGDQMGPTAGEDSDNVVKGEGGHHALKEGGGGESIEGSTNIPKFSPGGAGGEMKPDEGGHPFGANGETRRLIEMEGQVCSIVRKKALGVYIKTTVIHSFWGAPREDTQRKGVGGTL